MTDTAPAEVFPPGEFLREELEARGWTQGDLAEILGRPERLVNEVINGKRSVTPETAHGLAQAFGTSAQLWLNLDSVYRLSLVQQPDDAIAKKAMLFDKAPVKEMVRRGWLEPSKNPDVLEQRLIEFFEVSSLDSPPQLWAHAARKSTSYEAVSPAQWAWLYRARQLARTVDAAEFSVPRLKKGLVELRTCLRSPQGIGVVPDILANSGVRLVVVEHLSKTKIDGACFWLDKHSPVVVLSLRYDRIDGFWHSLSHELGHVIARDGLSGGDCPIDLDLASAQNRADRPKMEQAADQFAVSLLLDQEQLNDFSLRVRPQYSHTQIEGFAKRMGVHPGIVVGQLQHRGYISFARSRKYLVKMRAHLIDATITDGWDRHPSI